MDNYNYPAGADNEFAPWNRKDEDEEEDSYNESDFEEDYYLKKTIARIDFELKNPKNNGLL